MTTRLRKIALILDDRTSMPDDADIIIRLNPTTSMGTLVRSTSNDRLKIYGVIPTEIDGMATVTAQNDLAEERRYSAELKTHIRTLVELLEDAWWVKAGKAYDALDKLT